MAALLFSVELGVWSVEFKEVSACADKFDSRRDLGIAPYIDCQSRRAISIARSAPFLFTLLSSLFTLEKITLPLGRVILFR